MSGCVIGIDPSTKSGVVILDSESGDLIDSKLVSFKEAKDFHRLQLFARSFDSLLKEYKPQLVVIEGYAFANAHTLVTLVEIGTIIRYSLHSNGVRWNNVPPTVLKKWVTGKGNAKKSDMAVSVAERWGFNSKSDDIVDAFALAKLGHMFLGNGVPKFMKGVISYEVEPV